MSDNLINMDDLMAAMEQLQEVDTNGVLEMSEEMQASQRRYEEYIKKHTDQSMGVRSVCSGGSRFGDCLKLISADHGAF